MDFQCNDQIAMSVFVEHSRIVEMAEVPVEEEEKTGYKKITPES